MPRFFDESIRRRGKLLTVLERRRGVSSTSEIKVAVVASKKAVGQHSHDRNFAKRRVLSALRSVFSKIETSSADVEWVVLAARPVLTCSFSTLENELVTHWQNSVRDAANVGSK